MKRIHWLRVAWKRWLARHRVVYEFCHRCGAWVGLVWTAPDDLWGKVTGRTDGGGVLCIRCFDGLARRQGRFLRWVPREEDKAA